MCSDAAGKIDFLVSAYRDSDLQSFVEAVEKAALARDASLMHSGYSVQHR